MWIKIEEEEEEYPTSDQKGTHLFHEQKQTGKLKAEGLRLCISLEIKTNPLETNSRKSKKKKKSFTPHTKKENKKKKRKRKTIEWLN